MAHYAKGASTLEKTNTAGKGCGTSKKFSYRKGQKYNKHAEVKLSKNGYQKVVIANWY
jgi:hypothetical protein